MAKQKETASETPTPDSPAKQKIIVEVTGGVISNVSGIPDGYEVEVRDYDSEAAESADDLQEDEDGNEYIGSTWG